MKNLKTLTRFVSALALAVVLGTTAAFAQTPAPAGTHVKGYTKTTKTGKVVQVKGYDRAAKAPLPKIAAVKSYTKTLKSGKTVQVKGYTRKVAPKGTKPSL